MSSDISSPEYSGPECGSVPRQQYSFWQINMGHVITLSVLLIGFITTINRFDYRIATLENLTAAQTLRLNSNEDKVGTANTLTLTDTALGSSNERRLSALEAEVTKMAPDIAEIKTNVQWMIKARP